MKYSELRKLIREEVRRNNFVARYNKTDIFISNLKDDTANEKLYNEIGKLFTKLKLSPKRVDIKF